MEKDKQQQQIKPKPKPRCLHGPNAYCINCMRKQMDKIKEIEEERRINNDKTPMTLKPKPKVYTLNSGKIDNPEQGIKIASHYTQNGTSIRGLVSAKKGRPVAWLCNHKEGEFCSHCIGQKLKDREKEEKKHFDPKKEKEKEKDTVHRLTKYCRHPESMTCPHCIPNAQKAAMRENEKQIEKEYLEKKKMDAKEYFKYLNPQLNCPNHGPNGFCTRCMQIRDDRRLNIEKTNAVCRSARFNVKELNKFQLYVSQRNFFVNRIGILYGRFAGNNCIVEAIFEPSQKINNDNQFEFLSEESNKNVDEMCKAIGLVKVGVIFSHARRDNYILSTQELIDAAKRQLEWDKRCITAVCCMKNNQVNVEAFQASSQLEEIIERKILDPKQPSILEMSLTDEVFLEGRTHKEKIVNSTLFVSNVSIFGLEKRLMFANPSFPVENRPDEEISLNHFKQHFEKTKYLPVYEQLMDFHLLIYCLELGIFTSNEMLRDCLVNKQEKLRIKEEIKVWLDLDM